MSIRLKILLIVLPLLAVSLVMVAVSSFFSASTALRKATSELLNFESVQLEKHIASQWNLLVENGFTSRPEMIEATGLGIQAFSRGLMRTNTEMILALDQSGALAWSTRPLSLLPGELETLRTRMASATPSGEDVILEGIPRVSRGFLTPAFGWYLLVTEERSVFYADLDRITRDSAIILLIAVLSTIVLLQLFIKVLTSPLVTMVGTMKKIITSTDLSQRVAVEFPDEIGTLSHTFNLMLGELEKAYTQIKKYAYSAVLAQKKERKIRQIFQKYVPQELIEKFFASPESMLVGENRKLSVLFSDIRSFTTISESMSPDELVNNLNRYFNLMVDIIYNSGGIIDKYIGDAIMAFYGAPVSHVDDAYNSLKSAFGMMEAVRVFNRQQVEAGKPEFHIGIGLNYGLVTVGNIGAEKKMDYTVIGDTVNLASRLEGLTKEYHSELIFAEFLYEEIKDRHPSRLVDAVAVKGKKKGVLIYTSLPEVSEKTAEAWSLHNQGMEAYFSRDFEKALGLFRTVQGLLGNDDYLSEMMIQRCQDYRENPPDADWDGVKVMKTK